MSNQISKNRVVDGKNVSFRLESITWKLLGEVAKRENCADKDILSLIKQKKAENDTFASAIRQFLMLYFRAAANDVGHKDAGHGDIERMRRR